MDVDVGCARDAGDPVAHLLHHAEVVRGVAPRNLHVDRRRQPEAQNLVGDIGRLEEEHHVGKGFPEPPPQLCRVLAHRPVLIALQRDQDLAIRGGNIGDVALRQAAPRVGNADVAENGFDLSRRKGAADLLFHVGEAHLGLFDSRARRRARVQPQRAGVDVGKKVLADQPDQRERAEREHEKPDQDRPAMAERKIEQADVAIAQPLEPIVHPAMQRPQQP